METEHCVKQVPPLRVKKLFLLVMDQQGAHPGHAEEAKHAHPPN
ncbi:MAG TPA: hypothetical protein VFN26_13795 [Candidatus Acidoferrum sp.]|nr:hypothetical protein [Candidatus Acidoferrum sp.]